MLIREQRESVEGSAAETFAGAHFRSAGNKMENLLDGGITNVKNVISNATE